MPALRRTAYLLLSLVLGTTWMIVLVIGISAGLSMAITLVGIPILVAVLWAVRWMAETERWLCNRLLGVEVTAAYRRPLWPGIAAQITTRLGDPQTWKDLAYLFVQFPLGILWFAVSAALIGLSLGALSAPAYYWAVDGGIDVAFWRVDTLPEAIVLALIGVVLCWGTAQALDLLGRLHGAWARLVLGSSPDPEVAAIRSSQARIIQAADDARRRIERDLHDGAQQRLVSLSLKLAMARRRLEVLAGADGALELVADAHEESKLALDELRDLARGIHPTILTERGLGPALDELAARATVPARVLETPDERLPAPIEAAAYFVVAESLVNVGKYARAGEATVRVTAAGGRAVVEVADDGVGGADPSSGSGLRGLADRVEALGGRLTVRSPAGAGTTVRAEMPLAVPEAAGHGRP